jgi:hypothetical protein
MFADPRISVFLYTDPDLDLGFYKSFRTLRLEKANFCRNKFKLVLDTWDCIIFKIFENLKIVQISLEKKSNFVNAFEMFCWLFIYLFKIIVKF